MHPDIVFLRLARLSHPASPFWHNNTKLPKTPGLPRMDSNIEAHIIFAAKTTGTQNHTIDGQSTMAEAMDVIHDQTSHTNLDLSLHYPWTFVKINN
jgi:hypothetical protein